jgi:hypothetical protein
VRDEDGSIGERAAARYDVSSAGSSTRQWSSRSCFAAGVTPASSNRVDVAISNSARGMPQRASGALGLHIVEVLLAIRDSATSGAAIAI